MEDKEHNLRIIDVPGEEPQQVKEKIQMRGLRNGSAVKSMYHSCRVPAPTLRNSQLPLTLASWDTLSLSVL